MAKWKVSAVVNVEVSRVFEADTAEDALDDAENMNASEWLENGDVLNEWVDLDDDPIEVKPKRVKRTPIRNLPNKEIK